MPVVKGRQILGISRAAVKTGIAVAMAVVAIAATTTGADAATGADGFPIIYASDHANDITVVHVCRILGTDDDYHEAIVCVDINTMTWDGEAYAQGEVEAYCQDEDGDDVQCANITVEGQFSNGADGVVSTYSADCGHQYGPCPTGRLYDFYKGDYEATAAEGDSSCGTDADSNANIWSIADGVYTTIQLPGSDDTYTLDADTAANDGNNLSTGHYYICY
jgi:hypothetical protein